MYIHSLLMLIVVVFISLKETILLTFVKTKIYNKILFSFLKDDIPESDPESCGNEGDGNDDEDDGDDEDEDEDDDEDEDEDDNDDEDEDDDDEEEELHDPNEVSGNFLLESATDQTRNLKALFEAASK